MTDTVKMGGGAISATATITVKTITGSNFLYVESLSGSTHNCHIRINGTVDITDFYLAPGKTYQREMYGIDSFSVICDTAESASLIYEALRKPTVHGRIS